MSYRKFRATNVSKNSRVLFNERGKYNNDGIPTRYREKYPGLFRNFWFIENMYYGRIDRSHRFISLKIDKLEAVNGQQGNSIFMIDFVSHALRDFLAQHRKALGASKIQKNDDFLSELDPYKGHQNLLKDYDLHMTRLKNEMHSKMIRHPNKIKNFDDFIDFFLNEVFMRSQPVPLTLTGFISSRHSSPMSTGLFVDLVELDFGDDMAKVANIVDRPNFQFLMNNCIKHGFMIDYNVPTRLCANLGSGEMEKYMSLYGTSASTIFNDYYDYVYTLDHVYFMNYMRKYYNKFVGFRPNIIKESPTTFRGDKAKRYIVKKHKLSQYSLAEKYDEKYRINLYVNLRNYETNNRYSPALIEKLKDNAMEYLNLQGLDKALEYIDYQFIGFLNDPYAYNGFIIAQDVKNKHEEMDGQSARDLLSDSVTDSRKTFY
jgi:hypothetical protein